jgi:sugar lactone lactonase YvrE
MGAALAALAAVALASTGALTYKGCIANDGDHDCKRPVHDSLGNNDGIAISPDGTSIYVAAYGGSLTSFQRSPNGGLVYDDCFADRGAHDCRNPSGNSLGSAAGVAVSPDGTSVYVVSEDGANSITRFSRAPTGRLTFEDCISNRGVRSGEDECRRPTHNSLYSNEGVAVSPDGRSVYVVSSGSSSITRFDRAPSGALAYRGCTANGGANGCRDPKHNSLGGAFDVAVSPDGASVYVASLAGNSVSRFDRARGGVLTYKGCFANGGAHGCRRPAHNSLEGANSVALSPDGDSVYVTALEGNSISRFDRSSRGVLDFAGCIANGGANGCREPQKQTLAAPDGVAVSPDGSSVFVTAMTGPGINGGPGALTRFNRDSQGALEYGGCFADRGKRDCRAPLHDSLGSPMSMALSPDGTSLYVGSFGSEVSRFQRRLALP